MFEYIIGTAVAAVMLAMVWESSKILDERKARYRAGTHDYYDNKIEKDDNETVS